MVQVENVNMFADMDGSSIEPLPSSPSILPGAARFKVVTPRYQKEAKEKGRKKIGREEKEKRKEKEEKGEKKWLEVIVVDGKDAEAAVRWLVDGMKERKQVLLGLDTESVGRRVVLLQLSTATRCVLIRLLKNDKILQCVKDVLENRKILKAGAELLGDALDLVHDHATITNGLINLSPYYREGRRQIGLKGMFDKEYGSQWVKDKKVTISDWNAKPLSLEQVKYAALDAWVSYMVGLKVMKREILNPVHLDHLAFFILSRLALGYKQSEIMRQVQKKSFTITGTAEVQKDSMTVNISQTRYDKKVRPSYNVFAHTREGEKKSGKVKYTKGKLANLKMQHKIKDGEVVEYTANNFNERDLSLENQQKTIKKIIQKGKIKSTLLRFLLDPTFVPPSLSPVICEGALSTGLNLSQLIAVERAINNPITLIHGPPGTGKTHTIARIAQCLTLPPYKEVVVIAAKQNVAAQNILHALKKRDIKGVALYVSADYFVEWHEEDYEEFMRQYIIVGNTPDPLSGWRKNNPGFEHPNIVVCTTGSLAAKTQTFLDLLPNKFSTLIVDESSQLWLADLLPIIETSQKISKLVMVGDYKQLPPFGSDQMKVEGVEGKSLFEQCVNEGRFAYQLLDVQYRMPAAIGEFISNSFYEGKLLSSHTAPLPDALSAITTKRVLWVDTKGKEEKTKDTKSWYNSEEIKKVVELVAYLARVVENVVVVVPYEEQRGKIERELQEIPHLKNLFKNQTIVHCIDGYQGREADVVVTSLVRSNPQGKLGFFKSLNRLNVMFSRAKSFMCVVGNFETVRRSQRSKIFSKLEKISRRIPAEELTSILEVPVPPPSIAHVSSSSLPAKILEEILLPKFSELFVKFLEVYPGLKVHHVGHLKRIYTKRFVANLEEEGEFVYVPRFKEVLYTLRKSGYIFYSSNSTINYKF